MIAAGTSDTAAGRQAPIPGGPHVQRFLDREGPHGSSLGRINVFRHAKGRLIFGDLFHTVVHLSTAKIIALFCMSYTLTHLTFAVFYFFLPHECALEIESGLDAFYLSLEIGMTIGWGIPTPYFKYPGNKSGCILGAVVVLAHTLTMHVQNALLIGVLYARTSRGTLRASSMRFSSKAVIREVQGRFYFMFQVVEGRKHQLTEAKTRCYVVLSERDPKTGALSFQQRTLRLLHPDDELGGMLLPAVPSLVVHEIDAWSALCERPEESPTHARVFPARLRRAADDADAESDEEGSEDDSHMGLRRGMSRAVSTMSSRRRSYHPTREHIEAFFAKTWVEVVVLVEGNEPVTATSIQARYSYRNEDIRFDAAFAPCVTRESNGQCVLHFERFEDLIPAPPSDTGEWVCGSRVQSRT